MFRTKRELDNYVLDTLSKIPSEKEKISRCFSFALAYCKLREFETARRYLEDYLKSDASNLFVAHKLMGDILVELGRNEEALEHYKKSYELGKTRDVLNKVCALIQNGYGRNETPQSKANWLNLQRATSSMRLDQGSDPSPVISSPKLYTASPILSPGNGYSPSLTKSSPFTRAVSGAGLFGNSYMSPGKARLVQKNINNAAGSDNIGETLLKLIESEKATVSHHTTLLQFYLTDKKLLEAAAHVHSYMLKFASSYDFLEKAVTVMEEVIADSQETRSFKGMKLSDAETYAAYFFILENFIGVLLDPHLKDVIPEAAGEKRLELAAKWIFKFDQQLFLRGRKVRNSPLETWWPPFLKHCKAQLMFFIGILLKERSKKDGKHLDLFRVCFELASSFMVEQPICLIKLRDPKIQQRIFIESCYRFVVTHSALTSDPSTLTFTPELKELIYTRCFPAEHSIPSRVTSEYFSITSLSDKKDMNSFSEENYSLFLKVAQLLHPQSLHHQVWIQLRKYQQYGYTSAEDMQLLHSVCFEDIPLTVSSDRPDADSISQLDVDIFLSLSVALTSLNGTKCEIPNLTQGLVSSAQANWWLSAYKLTHDVPTNNGSDWAAAECRLQVQRGLEMIRNTEQTMPASLINISGASLTKAAVTLEQTGIAKQFIHLSAALPILYQIYFEAAENYYRFFVESLTEPPKKRSFIRFFDVKNFPTISNEKLALEKAFFVLGWRAMERRDFENALSYFEQTSFPEASLFSAEIYRILAEEELEASAADSGTKYKALLQKTEELLYQTIDRRDAKPLEYLVGKGPADKYRAPMSHPKLTDSMELQAMLAEVEDKLKDLTMNVSVNMQQATMSFNGSASGFEGTDHRNGIGEASIHHPLEEFSIRTPVQKFRRSLLKGPDFTSTPRKPEDTVAGDTANLEEELAAAAAFAECLEKLLEQNSTILDTVTQIEDEIRDLNDRFESLKNSKKVIVKKGRAY